MTSTSTVPESKPELKPSEDPTMRTLLPTLFSSLPLARTSPTPTAASNPNTWTLLRTLKSENPNDIEGNLHGTATFTPLLRSTATDTDTNRESQASTSTEILYHESGSLPQSFGPGLRWTKEYIWRLSPDNRISVWFVKVAPRNQEKDKEKGEVEAEAGADYLFHEFEFSSSTSIPSNNGEGGAKDEEFVSPPIPPVTGLSGRRTKVIAARGNHLCINDMYRTAYAFRVDEESGEVLSWASRHVVKGPKKGQDIVNLYWRGG